jgi:hypothetical protein
LESIVVIVVAAEVVVVVVEVMSDIVGVLGVDDDAGHGGRGGDTAMVVMFYGECRTDPTMSSAVPWISMIGTVTKSAAIVSTCVRVFV